MTTTENPSLREIFESITEGLDVISGYVIYATAPRKVEVVHHHGLCVIFMENYLGASSGSTTPGIHLSFKIVVPRPHADDYASERSVFHSSDIILSIIEKDGVLIDYMPRREEEKNPPLREWYEKNAPPRLELFLLIRRMLTLTKRKE